MIFTYFIEAIRNEKLETPQGEHMLSCCFKINEVMVNCFIFKNKCIMLEDADVHKANMPGTPLRNTTRDSRFIGSFDQTE